MVAHLRSQSKVMATVQLVNCLPWKPRYNTHEPNSTQSCMNTTAPLKEYSVWIVPPKIEGGLFRLCIHPRLPLKPNPKDVAQTLVTREKLRSLLLSGLHAGQNSFGAVERIITGAATHTFDLKSKGTISLSDEAAHRLGWNFDR
jgi:hypothetical protein